MVRAPIGLWRCIWLLLDVEMNALQRGDLRWGYTLVELLAAMATLCVILLMLFSTTGMATLAWRENMASSDTFQQTRTAFATMTRRLSQATLNSYRDYYDTNFRNFNYPNLTRGKTEYRFRSDLHFISGPSTGLISAATAPHPTHAIFFQAPLGYQRQSDVALRSVLNVCGYYLEYGDDSVSRPSFVSSSASAGRVRTRLYEVLQPSEDFALYRYTPRGRLWLNDLTAAASLPTVTHVLADNVVALILLPQRRPGDADLAPSYNYDSRLWQSGRTTLGELTQNQLPPLMQVTMVVIDESSAKRLQDSGQLSSLVDPLLFQDAAKLTRDLEQLQDKLKKVSRYRCFQTTVSLNASTWSEPTP